MHARSCKLEGAPIKIASADVAVMSLYHQAGVQRDQAQSADCQL